MSPDWGVEGPAPAGSKSLEEVLAEGARTKVRLPPMYYDGPMYQGLRPDTLVPGITHPEEMTEGVTFRPPSARERIAAAHQKRRQMQQGQAQNQAGLLDGLRMRPASIER